MARVTKDKKWEEIGGNSIEKMRSYAQYSAWNFSNKLELLQAELHYLKQEYRKAELAYEASIASACEHKFHHEEALALELYGIYLIENGRVLKGLGKLDVAIEKYNRWGAKSKVRDVKLFVERVDKSSNLWKGKYTSLVIPAMGSGEAKSNESAAVPLPVSVDGPLSLATIQAAHPIKITTERTNVGKGYNGMGQLARRACQMKAEGCKGRYSRQRVSTCCHHGECSTKYNSPKNGSGDHYGLYICRNHACQLKHWNEMYAIATSEK